MDTPDVEAAADRVGDSRLVEWGARLGYAVSGLVHLLIAGIALDVAWFPSHRRANQSGALGALAHSPGGALLLWVTVAGFTLLGVWQLTETIRPGSASYRAKAAGKLVLYAALGWTAFEFAIGSSTSSKAETKDFTAIVMQHTGGRVVIAAIGLAIVGVGGYHAFKGWKKKFLDDLRERPERGVVQAARAGYLAKGVALVVVGFLFLIAAARRAPSEATGLDGGLRTLSRAPGGTWLLSFVALGIAAYGVYSFARARHARV